MLDEKSEADRPDTVARTFTVVDVVLLEVAAVVVVEEVEEEVEVEEEDDVPVTPLPNEVSEEVTYCVMPQQGRVSVASGRVFCAPQHTWSPQKKLEIALRACGEGISQGLSRASDKKQTQHPT